MARYLFYIWLNIDIYVFYRWVLSINFTWFYILKFKVNPRRRRRVTGVLIDTCIGYLFLWREKFKMSGTCEICIPVEVWSKSPKITIELFRTNRLSCVLPSRSVCAHRSSNSIQPSLTVRLSFVQSAITITNW